ncbi:GNAT family N-acetyltransferase [Pseudomonas sp. McL0111]|uniref:GNAT family N-acetyltransferase n=1 Tax=Pseudomonas sp. McL0111 TaxID=3457357 RepID=UPI00403E3A86
MSNGILETNVCGSARDSHYWVRDPVFDIASRLAADYRWSLAAALFRHVANVATCDILRSIACFNLSLIFSHTARYAKALEYLDHSNDACRSGADKARTTGTINLDTTALDRSIAAWQQRNRLWQQRSLASLDSERVFSGEGQQVFGLLLGSHHAGAVYRKQLTGRQAMLGALQHLTSVLHVEYWIEQNYRDGNILIGIMSARIGLVGVVRLRPDPGTDALEAAQFYYWIASAHQRKGFGVQALKILLMVARQRGVGRLTARVRKENIPSHKTLLKSGAVMMPGNVDDDALHYVFSL